MQENLAVVGMQRRNRSVLLSSCLCERLIASESAQPRCSIDSLIRDTSWRALTASLPEECQGLPISRILAWCSLTDSSSIRKPLLAMACLTLWISSLQSTSLNRFLWQRLIELNCALHSGSSMKKRESASPSILIPPTSLRLISLRFLTIEMMIRLLSMFASDALQGSPFIFMS